MEIQQQTILDTNIKHKMENLLEKLGQFSTPDELAWHFEAIGIQGIPGHVYKCPIAEYFQTQISDMKVSVMAYPILIVAEETKTTRKGIVHASPVIREFMKEFDSGHYPALQRKVV